MNSLIVVCLLAITVLSLTQAPPAAEQAFLRECLRHWRQLPESWKLDDINNACDWEGINCDLRGSPEVYRITTVRLSNFALRAALPSSIGNLEYLETLNIWHADLQGHIPPEIGSLSELRFVNLCCNDLEGEIPAELTNLKRLRFLRLHANRLTGSIPLGIGYLPALEVLILESNMLSGGLPETMTELTHLHWLDVRSNPLSGCAPKSLNKYMVYCGLMDTNIACYEDKCGQLELPEHCFDQCKHNVEQHGDAIQTNTTFDDPTEKGVASNELILPYSLAAVGAVLLLIVLGLLVYVIRRRQQVVTKYGSVAGTSASYSDFEGSEGSVTDADWAYDSDSWDEFEEEGGSESTGTYTDTDSQSSRD